MGAKLGWIIGGLMVLVIVLVVVFAVLFPPYSEPTDSAKAGQLDIHQVPQSVATVLGAVPSEAGDAGDDYARALELITKNSQTLEDAMGKIGEGSAIEPAALGVFLDVDKHCAAAAKKEKMAYSAAHDLEPAEVVLYQPVVRDFVKISEALEHLAYYQSQVEKNLPAAIETRKHHFALGYHMERERLYVTVVQEGLAIQKRACDNRNDGTGLAQLYEAAGDKKKAQAAKDFADAADEVLQFHEQKYAYLCKLKPNPGDVFNVAANDKDPAWRLQAILELGMIRHTAQQRGDEKYANKLIDEILSDGSEMEKQAASAAKTVTVEELRVIGSKYLND